MNLRAIANSVSSQVNPNTLVTIKRSFGYTIDPATLKQVPNYTDPNLPNASGPILGFDGSGDSPFDSGTFIPPEGVSGPAQIQALTNDDLKQLDNLNIQGVKKAIYLRGPLAGVVRPRREGGDLVTVPSGRDAGTWLVIQILEDWPNWTKAVICLQGGE